MSCRFIYTQTCTTTPPWKVFGAPSNSTSSIAETLPATARHALKSSTTLNAFITASAPTARSATFPQLTSNSKTTNQMTRFYCPFFQSKPIRIKFRLSKTPKRDGRMDAPRHSYPSKLACYPHPEHSFRLIPRSHKDEPPDRAWQVSQL